MKLKQTGMVVIFTLAMILSGISNASSADKIRFSMVPSPAGEICLPDAQGEVIIRTRRGAERMIVKVKGLPPKTEFDLFVIQVPNAPFGMSWYQGDIKTNKAGRGKGRFIGRFNEETFIVAPGEAEAPFVHDDPFADDTYNPVIGPIHTYHVGLWFNSPADAEKAGCPNTVTPFNGEHNAGIQILNTSNFPDLEGPLKQLQS